MISLNVLQTIFLRNIIKAVNKNYLSGIDFLKIIIYNNEVITVTETVARAKAHREAAVGASRK